MATNLEALASYTLSRSKLEQGQIKDELAALGPRWSVDGDDLKLVLPMKPMVKAAEVAAQAAVIADQMDHHPQIVIEYPGVTLRIHTHDAKAITVTDLVFAARLEQWLRTRGW